MNQDKQKFFFEQYGLNEADLERYLGAALSAGGDYADLYFEYLTTTSITLDESMVKSASQGISAGCGVRVISGERTGYAYTDDLAPEKILRAAARAAAGEWRWTFSTRKKLPSILRTKRRGRRSCSSMHARLRRARWKLS